MQNVTVKGEGQSRSQFWVVVQNPHILIGIIHRNSSEQSIMAADGYVQSDSSYGDEILNVEKFE